MVQSVMNTHFSQVPQAEIQRSSFDRSHGYKTTFDAGYLIPVYVDEALPGDTFNCHMTAFARLATPLHPYMDNARLSSFFFGIPIRLLYDNWEKMNGAQDNPGDSTDYVTPTMTSPATTGYAANSIYDYMGIPTAVPDLVHTTLPLRAYNLVFNTWFRDENLINSLPVPKGDGPDTVGDYKLMRRGKRHDYFTSALPWPQKGPAVELPLGDRAPVATDTALSDVIGIEATVAAGATNQMLASTTNVTLDGVSIPAANGMYADLSDATAATINQLRQAFQIQRMYERDARGGTRYTEVIKAHFGVTSPDARLQRPEYLGGGVSDVNVTPIPQTSGTANTGGTGDPYTNTTQGNLAGVGTSTLNNHGFTKSFTEHCVIIGLVCATADLTYQQGLNRMWSRSTRFDYYWPALSHLGEQVVNQKEIYADGTANDDIAFGYQERYAEYRYKPSQITGQFRSNFAQSLDTWHLSQDFTSAPTLSEQFIEEDPPFDRVIAVQDEPHFLFDSYINLKCARPMPTYSVPGLIDHF